MKIEKVNDQQIRCTLTKADLADRELKISELAYGTEKAKDLFRDMMQQANLKFGFEADDIPLMIEAIPLNSDCIVLVITKVEDPEELDTRFSKFAPSIQEDGEEGDDNDDYTVSHTSEEVLDLFHKIKDQAAALTKNSLPDHHADDVEQQNTADDATEDNENTKSAESTSKNSKTIGTSQIFSFTSIREILRVVSFIPDSYVGDNYLYKVPKTGNYFLLVTRKNDSNAEFNRICNSLSEYSEIERILPAQEAYFSEHFKLVLGPHAIQDLKWGYQ